MFETIWNFIQDQWVWILVGGLVLLSLGRAMNTHPKYALKEIIKNPLRIFWLFAHAVDEAKNTINDAVDIARDVVNIVEPLTGNNKVGKAIQQANIIIKKVDAANEVLEATDRVAEQLGIQETAPAKSETTE
jgi:hypothetical protein